MRWSKLPASAAPGKPKRAVFADKSPQATPRTPEWLGKDPPIIAHRTQQRITLPPPMAMPSERPRPPSIAPPPGDLPTPPPPVVEAVLPVVLEPTGPSPAEIEGLAALRQALADIGSLREIIFSQTEHQLVELAVTIARHVLAREIATDPSVLVGLAREGIKALDERDKIVVRFGASLDEGLLKDFTEALRKDAPRCEIVLDPSLGPRECIVETELGRVDESVETRLYHVLEALVP